MHSSDLLLSGSYFNPGRHKLKSLHKKEQYVDRSEKHNENIKRDQGSQLSGLERKPSDVVCQ